MATSASATSSLFLRLANVWRFLSLRSDVDNIIVELLGRFSLEKIYSEGDKEIYQQLVATLICQLNSIFYVQRLTLPSENLQIGWYLGYLVSWEVSLRTLEFILQIVVEGREMLWDANQLRDKYLAEFLLNTLRVLTLHPKAPSNQRAKDRRERFARVHRSLERIYDSYPGPKSFLLLVCKEVTDSLRTDPNGLVLPARLRFELPNLASELYPLPECLSPPYISSIVPQDGFSNDWLAQFLALRDVSQFIVGASVQYSVNRETRAMRLQSASARSRNAVLHALESLQMPSHLSKMDLLANFSDTFRIILPDTLNLSRRDSIGARNDENEMDAIDSLCANLCDRQVVQRVSDREGMHGMSEVMRSIALLDDPTGQFRSARPRIFALNCNMCHLAGESQLRSLENLNIPGPKRPGASGQCGGFLLLDPTSNNIKFMLIWELSTTKAILGESSEYPLPSQSKCIQCGENVTLAREVSIARHTWDLLKPLEPNADTINVERHLPSNFQLGPPRIETGMLFRPSYGNLTSAASAVSPLSPDGDISNQFRSLIPPGSSSPDPSRSTPQSSLVLPGSPGFRQRLDTPLTDFSRSDNPSSLDGAVEAPLPLFSTPPVDQIPLRQESVVSFDAPPLSRKKTVPSIAPQEKSKSKWRSRITGSRKETFNASLDTSSLSSTTLESQRLEEISLKSLTNSQKLSVRGRGAKNISVSLSQNSTSALFWTQSTIHLWDVGTTPPTLKREISTDGNCVLAAVTKLHLAYIVGTRDQKLTLRIMSLCQPSSPVVEYRMPSSLWCKSIAICLKGNYVVVGFENSVVRFFRTTSSEQPREDRLHARYHKECKECPAVDTLSFSNNGLVLVASTRNPRSGMIQIWAWRFPFTTAQELPACRYHVPLHESEDNGVSSVIFRTGPGGEEDLVCVTTWTQSGTPVIVQPEGGHRGDIKNETSGRPGKLGCRIQCAAFSPSGRDIALVNDKGHLYQVSGLNSNPMDVRRIATSKELTAKSDSFGMTFMTLPDEEAIVLAWVDSSKGVGYVKKVPVTFHHCDSNPATPGFVHIYPATSPVSSRAELQGDDRMPKQFAGLTITEEPVAIGDIKRGLKDGF